MRILFTIIVGICAGYLAGLIWKGRGFGVIGNLVVGVCGAFLGGALFHLIGFRMYGFIAQLISALIGSLILLWAINSIRKR